MRLLVCGGRTYSDKTAMWAWLDAFHASAEGPIDLLIHGAARGADALADLWAFSHDITIRRYFAQWSDYGKAAGPLRNQQMLDEGKPDLVAAFPGNRGTANMVKLARAAGIKVVEVAP